MSSRFPTPVSGTPLPIDFAPSILFAVLYGILTTLVFFRLLDRRSRTVLLIGTAAFAIERIVVYSLRATQARNGSKRLSPGLMAYQQISFGMGYIGIANDLIDLARCMLVNTTFNRDMYYQSPASKDAPLAAEGDETDVHIYEKRPGVFSINWQRERFRCQPLEGDLDYPKRRSMFRILTSLGRLAFLAAIVPGIIADQHFGNLLSDTSQANSVYRLRYASSSITLLFILITICSTIWAYAKLPRIRTKAVLMLLTVSTLMAVISIYRLVVMYHWTTRDAILSTGTNTLNGPGAKAAFYILHAFPEWLASLVLLGTNVRMVFGTGLLGDRRSQDETAEERAKREEKKRRKAERKAVKS